jgi:hypothetical protein
MKNNSTVEQILDQAYREYCDGHWSFPANPNGPLLSDQLASVTPIEHSKESFWITVHNNPKFAKSFGIQIAKEKMSWEESVQWVLRNTDVELENLYIVEEIAKDTTPKDKITIKYKEKTVEYYA